MPNHPLPGCHLWQSQCFATASQPPHPLQTVALYTFATGPSPRPQKASESYHIWSNGSHRRSANAKQRVLLHFKASESQSSRSKVVWSRATRPPACMQDHPPHTTCIETRSAPACLADAARGIILTTHYSMWPCNSTCATSYSPCSPPQSASAQSMPWHGGRELPLKRLQPAAALATLSILATAVKAVYLLCT